VGLAFVGFACVYVCVCVCVCVCVFRFLRDFFCFFFQRGKEDDRFGLWAWVSLRDLLGGLLVVPERGKLSARTSMGTVR